MFRYLLSMITQEIQKYIKTLKYIDEITIIINLSLNYFYHTKNPNHCQQYHHEHCKKVKINDRLTLDIGYNYASLWMPYINNGFLYLRLFNNGYCGGIPKIMTIDGQRDRNYIDGCKDDNKLLNLWLQAK